MLEDPPDIIRHLYYSFNMRKADEALRVISTTSKWANPWEGGYCFGHHEIAQFWKRYWREVNVYGYPLHIKTNAASGLCEVRSLIIIRDKDGNCIDQKTTTQYFRIQNQLIRRFDVVREMVGV